MTEPADKGSSKSVLMEYIAAATVSLAILCGGAAWHFYSQYNKMKDSIASMELENSVVTQRAGTASFNLSHELEKADSIIALITNRTTQRVTLTNASASAQVFWNKDLGKAVVVVENLPAPDKDQQYHLWVTKGATTIHAGTIDIARNIQTINNISQAEGFVLSLENQGTAQSPSGKSLFLKGML